MAQMPESKLFEESEPLKSDLTDFQLRNFTLNVALAIGTLSAFYFGIMDILHHEIIPCIVSFSAVALFGLMLLLNSFVTHFGKSIHLIFILSVGILFLFLLSYQFPDPAIAFWCFPFPLVALFLLGKRHGALIIILYNIGITVVFILDAWFPPSLYTFEYAIRYCAVMMVISILAYYYETLRSRSIAFERTLNQSLEKRIEERTKALEKSQERLRKAEKLEAIGLLAGGVAHDFNNQLTGITAFADLIRRTSNDSAGVRDYAENILASARCASGLTSKLLDFARKGKLFTISVDVHRVVADVVTFLKPGIDSRIILKQELLAKPSIILGDPVQLENAVLNLALNARDAMQDGGELVFSTGIVPLDASACAMFAGHYDIVPGNYLQLSVTDTGCGMDEATVNRIFEPFFTTKEPGKGTGMGLPAVYGAMLSHKGAIAVQSEPGHGSSFHLYFPLSAIEAPIAGPPVSPEPPFPTEYPV